MKATFKEIKKIDKSIKDLNAQIESNKNFASVWTLTHEESKKLKIETASIESKIKELRKQRINQLETLLQKVEFEIGTANNDLRGGYNPEDDTDL